jgi:flagellar biosynthesis protein FlhF
MKLKSYFSGTVEAAMELARKEMGEDALLVHVRPATPETRRFGAFEVVFGIPPGSTRLDALALPSAGALAAAAKREKRASAENTAVAAPPTASPSPSLPAAGSQLVAAELDAGLARQVTEGTALEDLFAVDATLGQGGGRDVVALVGPPGAGKTTTLVKLAARYGLAARRPVHILSADVYRIAAADQIEALVSILGIGCTITETPAALRRALAAHPAGELLLIDTPGLGPRDIEDCASLIELIGSHPEMDVHLVLPATMQAASLRQAVDWYEPFHAQKLLFTHLDEAIRCGALINESARLSLPVSFLSTGQKIPDDIEPATKPRLCALVQGNSQFRASAGASA